MPTVGVAAQGRGETLIRRRRLKILQRMAFDLDKARRLTLEDGMRAPRRTNFDERYLGALRAVRRNLEIAIDESLEKD